MPVFNITKKSILLTVSSLVISQFMSHASNFDELDLKKSQTAHQTYSFEDWFDFNKINKVERSTSRESFDWFFNFDNYKISAPQKAKVNPNSNFFDIFTGMAPQKVKAQEPKVNSNSNFFDIFTGMAPQKSQAQEAKVNPNPNSNFFDIFTGMAPQKVKAQEPKVNSNSNFFDIFTGMAPQKSQAQEAKVNPNPNSNFFDFFNVMTSQKNENHNQEVLSELKVLRAQLEALTTQYNFNLNVLNKISKLKAKVKKSEKLLMEAKNNNLFTQLRSEDNDRSKQSNSNNNDTNKSILSPVEEKIEIFKNNSTSGAIQLTSTGSEKTPIIQLMEYIDQSNDKKGAEKLITYLMQEQNSSDPDRAESIENILNNINSLPKIIRDAHEAQIRKHDQDKMKSICDEGARIEIGEVEKVKQTVSSTSLTQINPASVLVLFTPQQLSKMDLNLVDEIKTYFLSLPVDCRKIIFKNLSSEVSGDKIQIIKNPNNRVSLQAFFSSLYESFNQPEKAFVVSTNASVRHRVEELNKKLIKFLKENSNIILTPLDPMTPPPPPPAAKKGAGAPPPPPPAAKKGASVSPAARAAAALNTAREIAPQVPPTGAGPGLTYTTVSGADAGSKGLVLDSQLKANGYSSSQRKKIMTYMEAHPNVTALTAVYTLMRVVDPEFAGFTETTIPAGT